ncbi:DUF7269 family protein [Haloarchaeobius amylolyticus]|uniref:DUF7269 family protein n=1 Tax=Haloarchaeobius amylolyticus TaxID=1198296 RepID=UPI00226E95E1|nr:hypothetical protein [Haloarchaeobius amylolyticus]
MAGRRLLSLRTVLVGYGLVALAVGATFIFVPGAVPGALRATVDGLLATTGPAALSLLVALLVGCYAVYRVWRSAGGDPVEDDDRFRGGDDGRTGRQRRGQERDTRTGSDLDATLAWAAASTTGDAHPDHLETAKTRLRSVLLDVLEHGGEYDDPEQAIATGAWTDDVVAAVFLGDPDESELPDLPVWRRLYGWLYPSRAFRRRYERTLAAVEAACADTVSGYDPPEQVDEDAVDVGDGFEPVDGSGERESERGQQPAEVRG